MPCVPRPVTCCRRCILWMHVVSVADSFEVSASVSPLRFAIPSRSTIWQIYFPRLAHSPSHAIDPRSIERASIHANARGWSNRWTTLPRIRRLADPAHNFLFRPFVSASPTNVRRPRTRIVVRRNQFQHPDSRGVMHPRGVSATRTGPALIFASLNFRVRRRGSQHEFIARIRVDDFRIASVFRADV